MRLLLYHFCLSCQFAKRIKCIWVLVTIVLLPVEREKLSLSLSLEIPAFSRVKLETQTFSFSVSVTWRVHIVHLSGKESSILRGALCSSKSDNIVWCYCCPFGNSAGLGCGGRRSLCTGADPLKDWLVLYKDLSFSFCQGVKLKPWLQPLSVTMASHACPKGHMHSLLGRHSGAVVAAVSLLPGGTVSTYHQVAGKSRLWFWPAGLEFGDHYSTA